jgi:hypothetical protein
MLQPGPGGVGEKQGEVAEKEMCPWAISKYFGD